MDELIEDSLACVSQGLEFLAGCDEERYQMREPQCFNSSIGGHFRHNIDHYWSLLTGNPAKVIDYDARARAPEIEKSPACARRELEAIREALLAIETNLDASVRVKMDTGGREVKTSQSSVRRELQFLLSHTVHHYALIGVIAGINDIPVPDKFGVAPSTLRFHASQS